MDIKEIKDLLQEFDQSSLKEFDLREGSFELYMNKNELSRGAVAAVEPAVAPVREAAAQQPQPPAATATTGSDAVEPVKTVPSGTEISSPIVGVVYLQPAPDKPNFKAVGDPVKKGEVICIVEAMKVMNEITSDIDGVISAILVENEQVVEFGQPLFHVQ